jgi:aspartate racemase
MAQDNVIGIIGGMGPYAGLDLARKVFDQTDATHDQDHLPVALLSYPSRIIDRSTFLRGETDENPADALFEIARQLDALGAVVAGIPCNTAHAPVIFSRIVERLEDGGHRLRLLHMIDETVRFIHEKMPGVRRIGVLSTLAVYRLHLYRNALVGAGFEAIVPDENVQENIVNRTIFDPVYGIKAQTNPISLIARQSLLNAVEHLNERGAEAVILGCTELPLAIPETELNGVMMIDPTRVLARALIRETYPEKLSE